VTLRPLSRAATEGPASRPTAWDLSAMAARAFADQPQTRMQWPILRFLCLRVLLLVSVATSERRVHPDLDAFCLLTKPSIRGRVNAAALGVAGALSVITLVVLLPVAFWLVVLALAVLIAPSVALAIRSSRPRGVLAALVPPGPVIGIHTVTSRRPGHGVELMWSVALEADAEGWTLVLDAANDRLARYYQQFGFVSCGEGVTMPWGETVVRMRREPSPGGPQ
jgi:hypothetical protein